MVQNDEDQPLLDRGTSELLDSSPKTSTNAITDIESAQDFPRSVDKNIYPEDSHLGRHLSWHSAYILVISRVIGSGIFATPGSVVRDAGSIGLSLIIWTVGAIVSACSLAVSLEYGCMLPRSGGDKVYLEYVYRRPRFLASTLVAVSFVILGFSASNCIVFSQYVLFALDVEPTDFLRKALAVGLLTTITIIHSCFPKFGVAAQNTLGWVKVALIIFMILTGLVVVIFQPGRTAANPGTSLNWDQIWQDSDWSWGVMATSLFKVFYSYAGLNNVNNVLNDVKNPVRTLKTVSIAALLTACILYTLINIAYFIVVPLDEIKGSGELIAALFFERSFGTRIGRKILPIAVALSNTGNVMVVSYALVS
jgi:amino acid transporter